MSVRVAALWSIGTQYAAFVIQFVVSVVLARYFLSPAETGLFSIALAASMMISIFQDFGITRYVAGQAKMDRNTARACTSVSVAVAWIIALVVCVAAYPVAAFYAQPDLAPMLLIIGASYLLSPFATVPVALLIRDLDFKAQFIISLGSTILWAGVALALASAGYGAFSLAWAVVVQALARAVLAQRFRPISPRWHVSREEARPILGFGSSSLVLAISGSIGMRSQDLIVGRLISVVAVGLYSRATALAGQLSMLVTGAINGVFFPAFARLRDQGAELGRPYVRVVGGITAIQWAAMAGLSVAAEPLILLLYGEKWIEAAPLLKWTALAEMCFVAVPMHMDMPILLGRINTLIRYNLFDTFVAVSLLSIGSLWGVEWAAIGRLGYGIVWVLIYLRFQQSLVRFEWRDILGVYARSAICALAAVTPMLIAYQVWREPMALGFDGLLLCTALGVLSWAAILYLVRHPARVEITGLIASLAQQIGLIRTPRGEAPL